MTSHSQYFAKTKLDFYDSLPIEKRLTFHNVTTHIKVVLNKDENHFYYKIFLEKFSYQLAKKYAQSFVHSIIMLKFWDREIAKEKLYAAEITMKIYHVNGDNIVLSKLVKIKLIISIWLNIQIKLSDH